MSGFAEAIEMLCRDIPQKIREQMAQRCVRVSNELKNAEIEILSAGGGGGRTYPLPGGGSYTASAPGEVPAVRTGAYKGSWTPSSETSGNVFTSRLDTNHTVNGYILGELLEGGTSKMAPRPHVDKILKKAEPKAVRIYDEPYFI